LGKKRGGIDSEPQGADSETKETRPPWKMSSKHAKGKEGGDEKGKGCTTGKKRKRQDCGKERGTTTCAPGDQRKGRPRPEKRREKRKNAPGKHPVRREGGDLKKKKKTPSTCRGNREGKKSLIQAKEPSTKKMNSTEKKSRMEGQQERRDEYESDGGKAGGGDHEELGKTTSRNKS